jgi:hypothetical protein
MRLSAPACQAVIALCVAAGFAPTPTPTPTPELPFDIRAVLDADYPGWQFATLDTFFRAQLRTGERPDWVAGDLDGDGKRDYVVQIVHPPKGRGLSLIVLAFLRRGSGYLKFAIDSGIPSQTTYLFIVPRGGRGFDVDTQQSSVYANDVIRIVYDETAAKDCPYRENHFGCVISGD